MMNYKGIDYLRMLLMKKRGRVLKRYGYYEMKAAMRDFSTVMPPQYRWIAPVLGWTSKAVDSLADRIVFREFAEDNFNVNEIFDMNNKDVFFDSAVLSALISSCCFVYISADEDGYPRLEVIDGGDATGVIDDITGLLTEGYAVLSRDDNKMPTLEAHFIKGSTIYYRNGVISEVIPNSAPYPLLVPIIYRPDAHRPFGHSRISRACMEIQQSALRTLKRSEISAEFYSFPQRYVLGMAQDAEFDKWGMTMSSMLDLRKDDDGDRPVVGQFNTGSMSPYSEQLKTLASLFAGETGLTPDDLGFAQANPSSSEAIKASHEQLRLMARKAQRTFGSGFLNVAYIAACVRDDFAYKRNQLYQTSAKWYPIFEPDAGQIGSIGDAVLKIQQAFPDYFTEDKLMDLTGM